MKEEKNDFKTNEFNMNECEMEERKMKENKENIKVLTEDDIIKLSNTEKCEEFLGNYRDWGVWLDIEQLGVKVFKAQLSDGSIIYITEFPARKEIRNGYSPTSYRYAGSGGEYCIYPDSQSVIVQRLKDLKVKIIQERREKNAEH